MKWQFGLALQVTQSWLQLPARSAGESSARRRLYASRLSSASCAMPLKTSIFLKRSDYSRKGDAPHSTSWQLHCLLGSGQSMKAPACASNL